VPIVLKSGSLNLLEPSGPVQACNGIALPLQASLKTFCLCKTLIGLLEVGKLEGAVNKLWALNTNIFYLDIDSSFGIVIMIRAG
jgi:uncharacterized membrane protein YGL010W